MTQETEQRLTEIEMALAHHEQLIDDLNEEIIRQGKIIDSLVKETKLLIEAIKESNVKPLSEETPPPHY